MCACASGGCARRGDASGWTRAPCPSLSHRLSLRAYTEPAPRSPSLPLPIPSLQRLLAERLEQCGWRDQVAALARDALAGTDPRGGPHTADALAAHLRPAARAAVPDGIKAELLAELRAAVLAATSGGGGGGGGGGGSGGSDRGSGEPPRAPTAETATQ
jgi:hypothetical protein